MKNEFSVKRDGLLHVMFILFAQCNKSFIVFSPTVLSLCRPPLSAGKGEASMSSSSLSMRDILRQRYSVTWHPRLLYLIVSDGYMATVMRVIDRPSPAMFLKTLLKDTSKDLEKASRILDKSQVVNQGSISGSRDLSHLQLLYVLSSELFLTICLSSHSLLSDSCEGMVGVCILPES